MNVKRGRKEDSECKCKEVKLKFTLRNKSVLKFWYKHLRISITIQNRSHFIFTYEFCSSSVILYICHWATLFSILETALTLQLITVLLNTQHGDSELYCSNFEHQASSLSIKCQQMADKKKACVLTTPALDFLRQVQLFSFTYCIKASGCNISTHSKVHLWLHPDWRQTWRMKTNGCDSSMKWH